MDQSEEAAFFADPGGLGFSSEQAQWLAEKTIKLCPPVVVGAGLAVSAWGLNMQGATAARQGVQRDPRVAAWLLVAGLGVSLIMVGPVCAGVKLKLRGYTSQYSTARDAILKLTPKVRAELRAEAEKLLRLKDNIDKAFSEDETSSPYYT